MEFENELLLFFGWFVIMGYPPKAPCKPKHFLRNPCISYEFLDFGSFSSFFLVRLGKQTIKQNYGESIFCKDPTFKKN